MEITFVRHAETEPVKNRVHYDNHGVDEYYPITDYGVKQAQATGEYLKKFGLFDAVYSSPRDRCLQTAQEIINKINYTGTVRKTDLLLGNKAGVLNGINKKYDKVIRQYLITKYSGLKELKEQIKNETNPFVKSVLAKKFKNYSDYVLKRDQRDNIANRFKKFLEELIKTNHKRVLVVSHGSTMSLLPKLIGNVEWNSDVVIAPQEYVCCKKKYDHGTCSVFGMYYNDNKFSIVIPPNNLHLESLQQSKTKPLA